MKEILLDAIIWHIGAVAVLAVIVAVLGLLSYLAFILSEEIGKRLMRVVRFETVSYWVKRMEREGLTLPQTEYRRMVEERKPKNVQDFLELNRLENERWAKDHMGDIE